MVFESLVADVLNRFIGEYVENLDSSQLNIGIWGGDVVLRDLKLKETCLDSLDLPIRTIYGHLGKLVLKIPWKNLYSGSVEASIDSLFLLVVPTQDVIYDIEKEENNKQSAKQNEISRIENVKFLDQQKNKLDQDKVKDSFVEKLATQIIRNVQINIKSIHIRYEDRVTFPNHPFSFGCTLYNLTSYSTDLNWIKFIDKGQDPLAMIYKVISMEGYAVYWNSKGQLFTEKPKETYNELFRNGIPNKDVLPDGYEYLLGPINAKANMKMNPKPELDGSDFTIPKYAISIDMESLNIRISKTQYQHLIMALESLDRLTKAMPYRKYRPLLNEYRGHYKEWWKFAFKCVLEEDVRRIHKNWDWNHMQSHRKLVKEYSVLYKQKLESKKPSILTLNRISELEKHLDVMNIIVTRQRVENEVEREGKIQEEIKKVESERGWFSYWRSKNSDEEEKEKDIIKQFEEAMSASEKDKLYKAIGYQETSITTIYPETFIDTEFKFSLHKLEISVFDEEFTSIQKVLTVNFKEFVLNFKRRLAANAIKIEASGETLSVFGLPQSNKIPKLITSKTLDQYRSAQDLAFAQEVDQDCFEKQMYLFNFLFETNPLNQNCDSRILLSFRPLKMVYDAQTIIKIMDIFTTQQSNVTTQLRAVADTKLAEIKEKSALGMQHIIQEHKRLELKIDMMASYVVIPHGGFYTKDQSLLVFNLGCLKIKSKPQSIDYVSIQSMHKMGVSQTEVLQEITNRSYDRYYIELENAQILIVNKGEKWKNTYNESFQNELYILKPTTLSIQVEKCLITDDPRLPLLKVTGELPAIDIKIAENRILDALSVFLSVPLPTKANRFEDDQHDFDIVGSALSIRQKIDSFNMTRNLTNQRKESEKASDINVQFTSLDVKLILKRLSIKVLSCDEKGSWLNPLLDFNLLTLELSLTQQTYNTNIVLKLGRLFLAQYYKDIIIPLFDTPNEDENQYLLLMKYTLVDKNSPDFHSKNDNVLQLLELNFTKLLATANRDALLYFFDWMNNVSSNITHMQKQYNQNIEQLTTLSPVQKSNKLKRMHLVSNALSTILEESATSKVQQLNKRISEDNDIKDLKLIAQIGEIQLIIVAGTEDLAHMFITKLESCITLKKSDIKIDAKLQNISVSDPSSDTIYKHIIHVAENDDALKFQMIMFNEQYLVDYDSPEMYMSISSGCIKCVFLNRFVTKLLNFINHFQAGKAAVYEAGAAAVATAKMNVKSATRIALDVNLKAPVFLVPQNSFSLEALCFDFGYLSITNSFLAIHKGADHIPAIIDKLNLNLQDLKVSRVKLNDDIKSFVFDCLLLQPISFSLIVNRNLSSAWYNDHPDFDIVAKFDSIKVTVSHIDYITVMKVLNENINEGNDELTSPNNESRLNTSQNNTNETRVIVDIEQNKSQLQEIRTLAKFELSVQNIILELFKEGPDKNGLQIKDNSMGQFMFSSLTVDGSMQTDLSLALTLHLLDVILDDTRVKRGSGNKVVRYMERKKDDIKVESLKHTIDIKYKQTVAGSDVQLKIFSFNLIFNVEYVQYLLNFFILSSQNQDLVMNDALINSKLNVMKEKNIVPDQKENKTLLFKLQLEKPDIILVESLDDINTNAIILNTEATLKLRMSTPTRQAVDGEIKDLQIYSCCYNPLKRKETMNLILRPVTVNVTGSTPDDTCLHVEVTMTPLIISVTPANIEMLNRINQTLTEEKVNISEEPKHDKQEFGNLWNKTQFNDSEFWFLKTELGVEACTSENNKILPILKKSEVCLISIPSIVFTIEAGIGTKTMPMLLSECTFNGSVNNWSSKLSVAGELTMQINYYNSRLALWEPFIEPVEVESSIGPKYKPWLLELKLETFDLNQSPQEEIFQRKPAMKISLISYETIEITMTKTALEVLTSLGTAFNEAITTKIPLSKRIETAPYVIQNNLGFDITIMISNTPFKLYKVQYDGDIGDDTVLKDREQISLCLKEDDSVAAHLRQKKITERSLKIKIQENNKITEFSLPLIKADKRYFNIKHPLNNVNEPWGLVTDTQVIDGSMVVTLRSVVQIQNHFNESIFIYYKIQEKLKFIGKAKPNKPFNLPVHSIYSQTKEILFCPEKYQICIKPFIWKDIQPLMNLRAMLQCPPNKIEDKDPYFIQVLGNMEHIYFEHTDRYLMSSNCYNIHLYPTVILVNALPVNLDCLMQGDFEIKKLAPGEKINLPIVEIGYSCITLQIKYLDKFWDCKCTIDEHPDEFSIWSFTNNENKIDTNANVINFGIRTEFHEGGTHIKTLYCPFWMINKTERVLTYKAVDDEANILRHSSNSTEPLMWSFKKKIFFANKRAHVKIDSGLWSDKFSLDVAGSSGSIICKTNDILYQIGVHIQLTNNSLTKQVTFTPFYITSNQCPFSIDVQEADKTSQPWIKVDPNSCMPFWPQNITDKHNLVDKIFVIRISGTLDVSTPLQYYKSRSDLIRLRNKYSAVQVDIQITEGGTYLTFNPYMEGMAPALIINHTDNYLKFIEHDLSEYLDEIKILPPKHKMFFVWSTPTDTPIIYWNQLQNQADLRKDGVGVFNPDDGIKVYWVSFLDGLQRILMFTTDGNIAEECQASSKLEIINREILISVHSLGLSLVNNDISTELMYLRIGSSGVIWETKKLNGSRYKPMTQKECDLIEAAFIRYTRMLTISECEPIVLIKELNIEVNFAENLIIKPSKRNIRRIYNTGFWLNLQYSDYTFQIHAKINDLQIDSQIDNSIFPVVFAPVPPPKTIAQTERKPFVELSIVERLNKNSTVKQYKYYKMLIQEFHIKLDIGFINALIKMTEKYELSEEERFKMFNEDLLYASKPLQSQITTVSLQEQKNYYDMLHFSPLKIHVTFSLNGDELENIPPIINIILQSIGVTITSVQDVVLKLAFFERQYVLLNQRQLMIEAQHHYVSQIIKQLYVLVLGLDVLGNPFGLVSGLRQGVEDLFYEPFQGAIQGPEEFAEGLVLGVKSLFGHTVGGAAGAVGRITGAMGKGIAALTFDKDYQKKRQEIMNQQPTNIPAGLAQGGRGLVLGVVEGVEGVFEKPISGARNDGVEGFFKGMCQGMVGLVARPLSGALDFTSGTLNTIKRVTDTTSEVQRVRLPRHFKEDKQVRPYSKREAEGYKLLKIAGKGIYKLTDNYIYHLRTTHTDKEICLVTSQRIMYIIQSFWTGSYKIKWEYEWSAMTRHPKIKPNGILLHGKSDPNLRRCWCFKIKQSNIKLISVSDPELCTWIADKISELMDIDNPDLKSSQSSDITILDSSEALL